MVAALSNIYIYMTIQSKPNVSELYLIFVKDQVVNFPKLFCLKLANCSLASPRCNIKLL